MNPKMGIIVFARHDSNRLPGKALRQLGGIPLLERVIRRARLTAYAVYLATTEKPSDDALVTLAENLGVPTFRGSDGRVLERAVLAAEAFGLDAFARLCGDRPLFPVDTLSEALAAMSDKSGCGTRPDLVTDHLAGRSIRGLTTEVVRTSTLRRVLDRGVSAEEQEHLTLYFYKYPETFDIVELDVPSVQYSCPGFALDTPADAENLDRIFRVSPAIDLTVSEADRIFQS